MPYLYAGATARSKNNANQWSAVDLSNVDLNVIFRSYSQVYVTLTHTSLPGQMYLDLNAVRETIPIDTGFRTISNWLATLGNATLPTQPLPPVTTAKVALYNDVHHAGYRVRTVAAGRHPDSQINPGDKHDLMISGRNLDFRQWWRYCLVTVNGMYHRVGASSEGLYVIDGARSGRIANDNQLGLHNFREVGALQIIPITPDMIYKNHPDQKYRNYAYVKLPQPSLNKTVMLVLGGYLHVLDGVYRQIGEQAVQIDFNNYKLPERILESIDRINLAPLRLDPSVVNDRMFTIEDLYDDATLLAYMTLPQSFIVLVDTNSLFVRRHPVEHSGLPGRYIAPMPLKRYPLQSALGRCYDYRAFPQDGRCVLACDTAFTQHYNFQTAPWKANYAIDDSTYQADPRHYAPAHLLEIGRT